MLGTRLQKDVACSVCIIEILQAGLESEHDTETSPVPHRSKAPRAMSDHKRSTVGLPRVMSEVSHLSIEMGCRRNGLNGKAGLAVFDASTDEIR